MIVLIEPQLLRGVERVCSKVITMGDPDRVRLFMNTLEEPMITYNMRGILVVNGQYKGECITLASHGIGCPMASIIFEELRALGGEVIVRIGTAGSLREDVNEGEVIIADSASTMVYGCGSRMYFGDIIPPMTLDPELLVKTKKILVRAGLKTHIGPVFSSDAFHAETNITEELASYGFIGVDMETAILYALSKLRRYKALSILVVSNNLIRKTRLKHTGELAETLLKVFKAVLEALIIRG